MSMPQSEWNHEVTDVYCPLCGEACFNPFDSQDSIYDEDEEDVVCDCGAEFTVRVYCRSQFRFESVLNK